MHLDDVIKNILFLSLLCKTNRFHVAMNLFIDRSQRMSNCGKNINDSLPNSSCAAFLLLSHFDVTCDPLLNRQH